MCRSVRLHFSALAAFSAVLAATGRAASPPDFTREVRPILSNYCFKCHGPDDKAREAELRLDLRAEALKPAESGAPAIVPGKLAESELITRILSDDRDEVMPPPSMKKPLSAEQKDVLKRWVAAGAEYRPHWAFVAPQQAPPPAVQRADWPRNAIDRQVLARLEAEQLAPAPEADGYTLVRRLSLDLIGLPPTPEQADEFVQAATTSRQAAVEALVDTLLASPQYGERWARRWLDLARYADTNGYEKDRDRSIWPWRDWVINALNADLPFDQFTIAQLAGDLLPEATREQLVATGFHRNTMLNEEGGIDPLEFRYHAMADRVATTGTTWLGLTTGCAKCHTHKYDPLTHREYFQLFAFLNNADEPELELPDGDAKTRAEANAARAARLLAALPDQFPVSETAAPTPPAREFAETAFAAWLETERARQVSWTTLRPVEAKSNLPLLTVQPDGSVSASGDISKSDTYELRFTDLPPGITAVRLEALPDERLPAHGPGMAYYEGPKGDFFLGEFQLSAGGQPVKFASAAESFAANAMGKNPVSAQLAIDGDAQTGWSTKGREGERHVAVFSLAQPSTGGGEWTLKMMFGRHYACSLGRFRISVTIDPRAGEARDLPEAIETLLAKPTPAITASEREQLREHFLLNAPALAEAAKQIHALRKRDRPATTLVFRERPPENPRPTFIHHRGEFLQPGERVEAGVPAVLHPLPPGAARDRLAFARWLVSRENPLTARVTVNRQWAALFGRGLVRTLDDFGLQGDTPSHPELLDWLAVEFTRPASEGGLGWSLKKLHRLIATSATYQQSSRVTPELLARDSENRLLSRGPRGRLEAEQIRDATLHAAGLLTLKIGGPSVRPPQPEGAAEAAYSGPQWNAATGPDRYRRGLYTFAKRTAPFAMLTAFDAPTGEACVARRDVSNSPLQALTLLNDVVFLEAAQALGKTFSTQTGSVEERVRALFRRVLTRPPTADETALLGKFFQAQNERFQTRALEAAKLAGPGLGDLAERAAWTALARALLNLDEAITRS